MFYLALDLTRSHVIDTGKNSFANIFPCNSFSFYSGIFRLNLKIKKESGRLEAFHFSIYMCKHQNIAQINSITAHFFK